MFSLIEKDDNNSYDPDNIIILRHDFQNDKFTKINSEMSVNRDACAAAVVVNNNNSSNNYNFSQQKTRRQNDQILVFGGGCPAGTDLVESYTCNINNNNFNQIWKQCRRRMPIRLRGFAAVSVVCNDHNHNVYLFGGCGKGRWSSFNREPQNVCYEYDVTNGTYKSMSPMKTQRAYLASVGIKKKLFAIGGFDEHHNILDTVEYCDTSSISNENNIRVEWHPLEARLNKKRYGCCSASVGDTFYVIGGYDENNKTLNTIEMYDTSKENSKFVLLDTKLKRARSGASAVALGYHIIIIGGRDENDRAFDSIEVFNTRTKEFVDSSNNTTLPTMTIPRSFCSAVLYDNDDDNKSNGHGSSTKKKNIVVIGGFEGTKKFFRTAEVIGIKTTTIPMSKFQFFKNSNDSDNENNGMLPSDINFKILSFL